jgi:tetratricopeptide (TPR) repeat protein
MKKLFLLLLGTLLWSPAFELAAEEPAVPVLPRKAWDLELLATAPPLGERGPSKTVTYEVKPTGPLVTVYVHAVSQDLDPFLRVEDGAGKLLGEDDNSGGGKTAFLRLEFKMPAALKLTAASAEAKKGGKLQLVVVEVHESEETLQEAAAAEAELKEIDGVVKEGKREEARARLGALVEGRLRGAQRSVKLAGVAWRAGYTATGLGALRHAESCWSAAKSLREASLPGDHPVLQASRQNSAAALRALGDLRGAEALFEKVLDVLSRTLPGDHPELQLARLNLAATLHDLGDLASAKALQETVLEVFTRTLPDDHPDLQLARQNLAGTLADLGDLPGARTLLENVVDVSTRTLPDDHPDLQAARGNLAAVLKAIGDLPGAKALQEKVLEVFTRTVPGDHPDLQWARQNLAATLHDLGDLASAKALQERVLEVFTRSLPDDHPDLQLARLNFAGTLAGLGDLPGAKALEEKVLEARTRALPGDHPDLQAVRGNFAATLKALGDLPGAKALQEKVLEILTRTLPDDHPDLQLARLNFAATLKALGDHPGAKALEEKVLEVLTRTLPDDHLHVQIARLNFAATLHDRGDHPTAKALFEGVLEVFMRTLPEDHPDLQKVRLNLATTLKALGDFPAAKALQVQALEVLKRTLPDDHPDLQAARGRFALTLSALGDLPGAKALEEEILDVLARTLPEGHPDLTDSRRNLAWTLARLGEVPRLRGVLLSLSAGTRRRLLDFERQLAPRQAGAMVEAALGEVSTVLSLLPMAALDPEERRPLEREAFALVETLRGASGSAARLARLSSSAPEAERRALERFRSEAAVAAGEVSRLAQTGRKAEAIQGAVRRREEAERRLFDALLRLPGAEEILAEASVERLAAGLGPQEAAVGFWRFTRRTLRDGERKEASGESAPAYCAFVVRGGESFELVDLGPAEPIEAAVRSWREELGTPLLRGRGPGGLVAKPTVVDGTARQVPHGEALRRLVLDPLLPALGDAKEITVALDGALHLVPLDALPLGGGLVGDRLRLRLVSSLRGLGSSALSELAEPRLLAAGGIDYGAKPSGALVAVAAWVQRGAPIEATRSGSFSEGLEPLAATKEEARRVAEAFTQAFPGAPGPWVLSGAEASKTSLLSFAPRARYLHLATHGWSRRSRCRRRQTRGRSTRGWALAASRTPATPCAASRPLSSAAWRSRARA